MTISTTSNTTTQQGNGSNTVWNYSFLIPDANSLVVTLTLIADGTTEVLDPSVYSVTGLGNPNGGSVTYPLTGAALSSAYNISIQRILPLTQELDLVNQGAFNPDVVESEFDNVVMMTQQLQEQIDRALAFPVGATNTPASELLTAILNAAANAASAAASAAAAEAAAGQQFKTGDIMFQDQAGARAGWVRDNGLTIGSATSGASERANADCQNLFLFLWNTYSDTLCPVVSGRGANAAADWAANKKITMPDKRFRGAIGLDDMGNSPAGRAAGVPFTVGDAVTPGSLGGEAIHTLDTTQIPPHAHDAASVVDEHGGHKHLVDNQAAGGPFATGTNFNLTDGGVPSGETAKALTGITVATTVGPTGGGLAHNNTQLVVTGTWYRKL